VLTQHQSLVHFGVKFVKNLTKHFFNFSNVISVIVFTQIVHWHIPHIGIKALNGLGNAVKCPPAEKRCSPRAALKNT